MTPRLTAYYQDIEDALSRMSDDEREFDDELLDDEAARLDESGLTEDDLARHGAALFHNFPLVFEHRARRMEREARAICATVGRASAGLTEALAAMRAL